MHRVLRLSIASLLLAAAACYHATIDTGLTPSTVAINKSWASGWLWGLVPPSRIATASTCTHGVAQVETKHSFLNMLVGGLTGGIYSPTANHSPAHATRPPGRLHTVDPQIELVTRPSRAPGAGGPSGGCAGGAARGGRRGSCRPARVHAAGGAHERPYRRPGAGAGGCG